MNIVTMNQRPITVNGIVMIPFRDPNLDPDAIACYTPAVVTEIASPERITVYEANGPRKTHDADPRECYPIPLAGQLLDVDGTVVNYYGAFTSNYRWHISRSITRVLGASGRNEALKASGVWGDITGTGLMAFPDEKTAREYIASELPAPALLRPFQKGDRVRTIRPRQFRKDPKAFANLTGVIQNLKSGYGWVTCQWDDECNPDHYASRDAYATYDLELVD